MGLHRRVSESEWGGEGVGGWSRAGCWCPPRGQPGMGACPEQGEEGDHVPLKVTVGLTLLCIQGLAECKAISRCPSTVMVIVRWVVK